MNDEFTDSLTRIVTKNMALRGFLLRLLTPEDLGHAVSQEVREEARKLLFSEPPKPQSRQTY